MVSRRNAAIGVQNERNERLLFVAFGMALLVSTPSALAQHKPAEPKPRAGQPAQEQARATSRPHEVAPQIEIKTFRSAAAALRALLRRNRPAVIGIGEYHQKKDSAGVKSSLHRFTRQLLPLLRRSASDLVIETWITEGNCGTEEQEVVKDVDKTTERPQQTENEIVTLVKRAQRYRIRPHILQMSCADYRKLLAGGDGVNYETFLEMTAQQLQSKIAGITKVRLDPVKRAVDDAMRSVWQSGRGRGTRDLVLVYGGALHNDLHPPKDMIRFTYAPAVAKAVAGRYLELDLFVPEYIETDNSLLRQQPWFPLFERHQSHRRVLLIRRAEHSYVIVFRRKRPRTERGGTSRGSIEKVNRVRQNEEQLDSQKR